MANTANTANKQIKKKIPAKSDKFREDVVLNEDSPFVYREAYKSLRASIMFAMAGSNRKSNSVVVTSSYPDEWKSSTSSNLALVLAELGGRVLLVDADLRNPTQHKFFNLPNGKGLAQLIIGVNSFDEVVNRNVASGLDVLTSGGVAPNPSELLSTENMANLFPFFEKEYDYVIIDTPPVNVVSDALMFVDMTCGVVLTVREGISTYDEVAGALKKIEMTKSPVLGVVLVDAKFEHGITSYKKGKYSKYYEYN